MLDHELNPISKMELYDLYLDVWPISKGIGDLFLHDNRPKSYQMPLHIVFSNKSIIFFKKIVELLMKIINTS